MPASPRSLLLHTRRCRSLFICHAKERGALGCEADSAVMIDWEEGRGRSPVTGSSDLFFSLSPSLVTVGGCPLYY